LYNLLETRLNTIRQQQLLENLKHCKVGLEKESLRVSNSGGISQQAHPKVLGSALTHPHITTDYSEALLELVTPPCQRAGQALDFLLDIETFVYQQLQDELLWTNSMPCVLDGEKSIRIAEYGNSNAGRMKNIYRHGLAWRYGKLMQVIAGVHFNYSIDESFWEKWHKFEQSDLELQDFINDRYMAMTRNIQRFGWLIPYLFGSSPAICKTFLAGAKPPPNMQRLEEYTLYEPNGTSLRMGDIGYTNRKESKIGIKANYNSLQKYTDSLEKAITTPCSNYAAIGMQDEHGNYRQLNTNILQIENEYYSSVRPKQILQGMERPIDALRKRGIAYVELRSVDINPFHPAGLTEQQLHFLEIFMLFCCLQDSPKITPDEQDEIDSNQSLVAHQGRLEGLKLLQLGNIRRLKDWGNELINTMQQVAELLDDIQQQSIYTEALNAVQPLINHPEQTPSARIIALMQENKESFFSFAQRQSMEHKHWFMQRQLSEERQREFQQMAEDSLTVKERLEAKPDVDFGVFLEDYFAGKG